MHDIFFYGLFMDVAHLRAAGLQPVARGTARLADRALAIGAKATLVPRPGAAAWGVVVELSDADTARLYATPGVEAYRPESVTVELEPDRRATACVTYVVDAPAAGERADASYVEDLAALARRLGFPATYVAEIKAWV